MQSKSVIVNQKIYHYLESGSGKPIVFLHGWCNQANDHIELLTELSAAYRVIAPDLPNFGASKTPELFTIDTYANFLTAFLKELKITAPIVVGHSFGGLVGLNYAKDNIVASLVLINSAGCKVANSPLEFLLRSSENAPFDSSMDMRRMSRVTKSWLKNISRHTLSADFWRLTREILSESFEGFEQINTDVHIIWGEQDIIFPKDYSQTLLKKFKNAKITYTPGGHAACINNPKQFADIIKKSL